MPQKHVDECCILKFCICCRGNGLSDKGNNQSMAVPPGVTKCCSSDSALGFRLGMLLIELTGEHCVYMC